MKDRYNRDIGLLNWMKDRYNTDMGLLNWMKDRYNRDRPTQNNRIRR